MHIHIYIYIYIHVYIHTHRPPPCAARPWRLSESRRSRPRHDTITIAHCACAITSYCMVYNTIAPYAIRLCYAILYYARLCYAMLCYTIL